jgi:hypothetical protein
MVYSCEFQPALEAGRNENLGWKKPDENDTIKAVNIFNVNEFQQMIVTRIVL